MSLVTLNFTSVCSVQVSHTTDSVDSALEEYKHAVVIIQET